MSDKSGIEMWDGWMGNMDESGVEQLLRDTTRRPDRTGRQDEEGVVVQKGASEKNGVEGRS
jgi:hypothetical protein